MRNTANSFLVNRSKTVMADRNGNEVNVDPDDSYKKDGLLD